MLDSALIAVIGDRHVGSMSGLMPVEGVKLRTGNTLLPSPLQKEVGEFYQAFWDRRFAECEENNLPLVVFNMGDNVDGRHHDSPEVWSDRGQHAECCAEMDMPIRRKAKYMFAVSGTPVHVGEQGEADILVSQLAGYDQVHGRWCNYHLRLRIGGVLFDLEHFGPSAGKRNWNKENQLRLYVKSMLMDDIANNRNYADVVIRAHRHKKVECLTEYEGRHSYGFITPSWQLRTEFGHIASSAEHIADVGGLVFVVRNGQMEKWQWDCLKIDDIGEAQF